MKIKITIGTFVLIFLLLSKSVLSQCTYTTGVPYIENFNTVSVTGQLPSCWAISSFGSCFTFTAPQGSNALPRTGNQFAAFTNSIGSHYFYTQGIYLNRCVNYSVSIWYLGDVNGSTNFSNLSILLSNSQSSVGLISIASTSAAVTAPTYSNLSATFTVASSGLYYFAIRATSNGSVGANYLSWDDFSVEAPASINISPINVAITPSIVCPGSSATISASGIHSFTWNNGANTNSFVVSPTVTSTYSVSGTNTINGCIYASRTASILVPIPSFTVSPSNTSLCLGSSAGLLAIGTNSFVWSTGASGAIINVSPTVSTTYSVIGINQFGCTSSRTAQVIVWPLPVIIAVPSNTIICAGDEVTLTAIGANSYSWSSVSASQSGNSNPIIKTVIAGELITITGTDLNGCSASIPANIMINQCAGLNEKSLEKSLYVFPNPSSDYLNLIGLNNSSSIEMYDLKGQLVYTNNTNERRLTIDLKNFDKGLYVLQIVSGDEKVERRIIVE
ncbi:MAG: T9SS type A sorting domain-containing protein [Bacteroidota bacterium]